MFLELLIFLFLVLILIAIHELAHIITAKFFDAYGGLAFHPLVLGIEVKIKHPCSLDHGLLILCSGLLLSYPYALFIDYYLGLFPLFQIAAVLLSIYDLLLIGLLYKLKQENPFAYYMPKQFSMSLTTNYKYFYEGE